MEWLLEMDGRFLLWLKETCAHPVFDKIMISVSALGNGGFLWIAIGVLFLLMGFKNKVWVKRGLLVLFSLGANAVVCNLLASVVGIAWMVFGYFIGGGILQSSFIVALTSIPENIVQGAAGLVIFLVVGAAFHKANIYKIVSE